MNASDKVIRWRKDNPQKAKELSRRYYLKNRQSIREKTRLYARRKTASGRTGLLLEQLLGSTHGVIVTRAKNGKSEFTTKELTRIRKLLCKTWKI